jgi:hypothetical protein
MNTPGPGDPRRRRDGVAIALLGVYALGVSFLQGVAIAA